jgi:RimJ/RimL family protein N-acetyltransferase
VRIALAPYEESDLALTEELELDPDVMRELGGPSDPARLPTVHRIRVEDPLYFAITVDDVRAGQIGAWEKQLDGSPLFETGWMVLPRFQGRGVASAALALLIERLRSEPRVANVHAFPPVSNAPSNALCRRSGFELLGERDFIYASRTLRCNHWMLATPAGG